MRVGFSRKDITPSLDDKLELGGYGFFMNRVGERINDRISASSLVIEGDNKEKVALISLDLIGLEDYAIRQIQEEVSLRTGIPKSNVLVSVTHTHSAPATQKLIGCGKYNGHYVDATVIPIAILSATIAHDTRREAETGIGSIPVKGISENRTGRKSLDDSLNVLKVNSKAPAYLLNFACHPVVLSKNSVVISRDYPGLVISMLDTDALWTTGCAGDINPTVTSLRNGTQSIPEDMYGIARKLADGVRSVTATTGTKSGAVHVVKKDIELPFDRAKFVDMLGRFKKYYSVRAGKPGYTDPLLALKLLAQTVIPPNLAPSRKSSVTGVKIGNDVLLALPGELFSETGLQLKAQRPNTTMLGYTNGNPGYIPPKDEYDNEVSYAAGVGQLVYNRMPLHQDCEEIVRSAANDVLKQLN